MPVDINVIEDEIVYEFTEGLDVGTVIAHQIFVLDGLPRRLIRSPHGVRVEAGKRHLAGRAQQFNVDNKLISNLGFAVFWRPFSSRLFVLTSALRDK